MKILSAAAGVFTILIVGMVFLGISGVLFSALKARVISDMQAKPTEKTITEVVIEQACVDGYEWVVLVNAQGQSVALEQVYKASEVPGACAQPVECQDL